MARVGEAVGHEWVGPTNGTVYEVVRVGADLQIQAKGEAPENWSYKGLVRMDYAPRLGRAK